MLLQALVRGVYLAVLLVVVAWVQYHLGSVAFHPAPQDGGANDTSGIFNWHPILMALGFPVFMGEALLAYDSPLLGKSCTRETRKKIHYCLHILAVVCVALGLWAAFASHSLKLPAPIPHLYSPHSFLGMATVVLLAIQFSVAVYCYLVPKASLSLRTALGPFHKFVGRCVWTMGLATMATGIQEKTTFLQMGKKLSGDMLFTPIVQLPGVTLILLAFLGCLVLFHQTPSSKPQGMEGSDRDGLLPPGRLRSDGVAQQGNSGLSA